MSVDAVGVGGGIGLGAAPEVADLAALLSTASGSGAGGVLEPLEPLDGVNQLPSVGDFEAVMLAAAGLCEEVIAEVASHSLGASASLAEGDGSEEVAPSGGVDSSEARFQGDFGFGPLSPAFVDFLQHASPAQLSEICANLEAGTGLAMSGFVTSERGVEVHASGGAGDAAPAGGQNGQVGLPEILREGVAGDLRLVSRVVGKESDVMTGLSGAIIDAALRGSRKNESGVVSTNAFGGGRSENFTASTARLEEGVANAGASETRLGEVGSELTLPLLADLVRQTPLRVAPARTMQGMSVSVGEGDLSDHSEGSPIALPGVVVESGLVQGSSEVLLGREVSSTKGLVPVVTEGTKGLSAFGVRQALDRSLSLSSAEMVTQLSPEASAKVVIDGGLIESSVSGSTYSARSVDSAESTRSDVSAADPRTQAQAAGGGNQRESSGAHGRESGSREEKSSNQDLSFGWNGRRLVVEPLPSSMRRGVSEVAFAASVSGASVDAGLETGSRGDVPQTLGVDVSGSTAFALVQRSGGFSRGVSSTEVRGAGGASLTDRLAGEVWSRLADSVARVRADRGTLKVEIDLPQGMSVEVELRGVSGGVNAVFRVGDTGLRQTLETMWSVLPRSEKVSALDLNDVSFERGASREQADSDSRGARQDAQRDRQERFDGDVRGFRGKSTEKNTKLGTPEATEGGVASPSRAGGEANLSL